MTDEQLADLEAEFERLAATLRHPVPEAQRAPLKAAIVELFRRTESSIAQLTEFKERIRELVAGFKALPTKPEPVSVRHDHLGASTYIERGWSALAGGDWEAAQAQLREALQLDATSTTAQALLGWALMYQNRHDEALELCLQVLLREPDHGLACVALGAICLRKGIVGEAIEHLTRATGSPDARATLYANFWLGVAYLERDMHGDAAEFLRRATALGPNLAEGWTELGRALWLAGKRDEARSAWTRGAAIRHSPFARRCSDLLQVVAAGGMPSRSPFT
ncbi:MAG: tetratricopeptide repeat protein [Gemmatimonadales bacterium]